MSWKCDQTLQKKVLYTVHKLYLLATHFWQQIIDPAQLHWAMRHFHSLVKCALSYWLAIVGSSLKKLYHHVIRASLATIKSCVPFCDGECLALYSLSPLRLTFTKILQWQLYPVQPLCQASVSPLRHWKVKTLHIHVHIHFCGFFHLGCKNRHMIGFKTRLAGSHMVNSITLAEPLKWAHHPSRCTLTSQNRLWFLLLIIPIVCWFCMKLPKTHQVELFHHVALHSRRGGGGR